MEGELTFDAAVVETPDSVNRPAELGRLFDRCHARLFALARRMSHDSEESRDLVQEAFLRAARRPGSLPAGESEAEAWLVRVLVNLCKDRQRRQFVRRRYAREVTPALTTRDTESATVARVTVRAALATLPPRRRACIVLYELEELSVREVAEQLGLKQVTVRWHLSAGRRQLARWRGMHAEPPVPDGEQRDAQ